MLPFLEIACLFPNSSKAWNYLNIGFTEYDGPKDSKEIKTFTIIMHNTITYLNWTIIFDWWVVKCGTLTCMGQKYTRSYSGFQHCMTWELIHQNGLEWNFFHWISITFKTSCFSYPYNYIYFVCYLIAFPKFPNVVFHAFHFWPKTPKFILVWKDVCCTIVILFNTRLVMIWFSYGKNSIPN